ncbi:hypothetical protein QZH41_007773 [Actinostola sp. cb2023]|nr:hypothetical protein QZH41_007773 [Actinostola sp. cb2023]
MKEWSTISVRPSSYGCTREAAKHEGSMRCADIFSTAHTKIKKNICSSIKPSASTALYDQKFMAEFFNNPRMMRINSLWEHLHANKRTSDVYSFVCTAMMNVCNCQNSQRLHDIGILCAEVTAHCGRLSSEWLGVLKALCCSSTNSYGFVDLLLEVEVSDLSIHESVATFTAIMIARGCFSLEDVIYHVAMDSLSDAIRLGGENQDAESGARLTCHLLLRLLDDATDFISHDHSSVSKFPFKSAPDHNLLSAAHDNIGVHAVLAILKAMLRLSESDHGGSGSSQASRDDSFRGLFSSRLEDFPDGTAAPGDIFSTPSSKSAVGSSNLSAFAGYTLQVICGQEWVRERCLQDPQVLFSSELLLDPELTVNQEMGSLLDAVATAAMNVFVQRHESALATANGRPKSGVIKGPEWLVAPLISRLPSSVQGRLLKAAGEVLGTLKWWKPHSDSSK